MKRIISLISFLFLALPGAVSLAQTKSLEFYYIAHDHYETRISSVLSVVHDNASNDPDRTVVFYLANGYKPLIHLVSRGDQDDYLAFVEELNSRTSHPVMPNIDRDEILDVLSGKKLLNTEGFKSYNKVTFNFFVTPGFVSMDYGDTLIGGLFWAMDLDELPLNVLQINVFHSPEEQLTEDRLFGRKKLTGDFPVQISTF